jgi:restriction system protein
MAVWVVRGGKYGEQEGIALDQGVSEIRWLELPDLSPVAKDSDDDSARATLEHMYAEVYPQGSPGSQAVNRGQIWAFVRLIKKGDLILLPLKTTHSIAVGKVIGDYEYRTDLGDLVRHVHSVKWLKTDISRAAIEQDLLYSLGSVLTVFKPTRNDAQHRLQVIAEKGRDPGPGQNPSSKLDTGEGSPEAMPDLEEVAMENIRARINAKMKGHGLARLVEAILLAEGYTTFTSPPGPDGGVDILAGRGPFGFDEPRLCVQVKSQDSPVDAPTVSQLLGVSGFSVREGLFVSWGGYTKGVEQQHKKNSFFRVRLWGAEEVIEKVFEHYEELPADIRADLPLKRIWMLVPDEEA